MGLLLFSVTANGQNRIFLSKSYQLEGAVQEIFQHTTVKTDMYGSIYHAGSTINSQGNYDILVKKWDSYGMLLWVFQADGMAQKDDYAMDMLIDDSLNVYVAGGITNQTSDSMDAVVFKINPFGDSLWSLTYDGGVDNNDIAASLYRDNSNNYYLTGSTYHSGTRKFNALAMKFNASGNTLWTNSFDYNSLDNSGLKINLDTVSGNLSVIGISYTGPVSNTYYVSYFSCNASSGLLIMQNSIPNTLNEFVLDIRDMKRNGSGELYLTGSSIDTGTGDVDIVLVKLSPFFTLDWMVTYNGPDSLNDAANSLFLDPLGAVYVSGYVGTDDREKDIVVLKYSAAGTLVWQETFKGPGHDEGNRLAVNNDGYVFVAGYTTTNTAIDALALAISPQGQLVWYKTLDGDHHNRDLGSGIVVDGSDNLIINAKVELGSVNMFTNIIVKYDVANVSVSVVEVDSSPHHVASQLLISFHPSSLITANINDTEKEFGSVADFVESEIIDSLASLIGGDPGIANWRLIKINPNFTTTDSVGYDIDGNPVKLMPVFNDFLMIISPSFSLDSIVDLLDSNYVVEYCGLNHIVQALTNDPSYEYQTGLYYNKADGNHINIEGAWAIETGHQEINVGIFDSGINFGHQDFDIGNLSIGVDESVVVDGLRNDGGFVRIDQDNSHAQSAHGTKVAGIVGAVRENESNIAGVAGGDFSLLTPRPGVSLYSLVVLDNDNSATEDNAIRIMNESQRLFNLHIHNYSWKIDEAHARSELAKSVYNSFRLKRIQIAASGNDGGLEVHYPASYPDPWVIKVGASKRKNASILAQDIPIRWEDATYGNNLDVMAPGVENEYVSLSWNSEDGNDGVGNGTSIAAPHVSGLVALLQSHVWREHYGGSFHLLHPEDIEYLIQENARDIVDIDDGAGTGYDNRTGHGIIDGAASLEAIEWPDYQLFQHELTGAACSSDQINSSLITVELEYEFNGLQPGTYQANVYKISGSRNHFATQDGDYLDSWIRFSGSTGYEYDEVNSPTSIRLRAFESTFAAFTGTPSTTSASLFTYMIEIVKKDGQDLDNPVFYPAPKNQLIMAYSIYVNDESGTTDIETPGQPIAEVFPNPNMGDYLFISMKGTLGTTYQIELFSIDGKLLSAETLYNSDGPEKLDTASLPKGIYLLRISYAGQKQTVKFVK